jgi:hypothetical protein
MKMLKKIKSIPFFIKLFNWEYWPFAVVYSPVYPVWFWYSLKAKSFFFFGSSNPTIKNAGFLMESKKEIDALLPEKYKPVTLFFKSDTKGEFIINNIIENKLSYPLIIKPDIGGQGRAVVKVYNDDQLLSAVSKFTVDFLIQPFIDFPKEVGIFYVRYPN